MLRGQRVNVGAVARYERDVLQLPERVTVRDASGTAIYDARATRNAATEITTIADLDGFGLDHSATFDYDGFARLTHATAGTGGQTFTFGYAYDALHNMTSRTVNGPRVLGAFAGTYRYGENGSAPRQLTSITGATGGAVTHTFDYDAAGRQTSADQQTMSYDASDRLLRVDGMPSGSVMHAYGHDGERVKTVEPNGAVSYLFGDGTAEYRGIREHDVTVGARVIGRVASPSAHGRGLSGVLSGMSVAIDRWRGAPVALGCLVLILSLVLSRARVRRRARAAGMIGLVFASACASPSAGLQNHAITSPSTTFCHSGFGAGPAVFTDAGGQLVEERRYEPFGVPIDAHFRTTDSDVIGTPDFAARDLNWLNKRTEVATGWSDHGARWMAPETGRWLTPDPLVMGPNADLMNAPWALHPYQYVLQNPIAYWDPDGRYAGTLASIGVWFATAAVAAVTSPAALGIGLALGTIVGYKAIRSGGPSCGDDPTCYDLVAQEKAQQQADASAEAQAQTLEREKARADALNIAATNLATQSNTETKESSGRSRFVMRAQVQQGDTNIVSAAIESDRPITAMQVHLTFLNLVNNMPNGYKKYESALNRATDDMRAKVNRRTLSGGAWEHKNIERSWLDSGPSPNIRLDLENLSGHNLRQLY